MVTAGTSSGVATRTIVTKPAQIKPAQTILQKPSKLCVEVYYPREPNKGLVEQAWGDLILPSTDFHNLRWEFMESNRIE